MMITCSAVPRNHQGRMCTADIDDNLVPSLTVLGCSIAVLLKSRPVHSVSVMVSSHLLFGLPIFPFPGTVPGNIFFTQLVKIY